MRSIWEFPWKEFSRFHATKPWTPLPHCPLACLLLTRMNGNEKRLISSREIIKILSSEGEKINFNCKAEFQLKNWKLMLRFIGAVAETTCWAWEVIKDFDSRWFNYGGFDFNSYYKLSPELKFFILLKISWNFVLIKYKNVSPLFSS